MVSDPHAVLGLPPDADDNTIRKRYLELVREFPPDHHPQRFALVREAYEALKDLNTRLRRRLFERTRSDSLDVLIEDVACRSPRRRVTLEALLAAAQTRS